MFLTKLFQKKPKKWWEYYDQKSLVEKLHDKFRDVIAYLIYDRHWDWLSSFIYTLCNLEMALYLKVDKELQELLRTADQKGENGKSNIEEIVPENSLYCDLCPFREVSSVATFFYGYQSSGYCHYIKNGDYNDSEGTMILWDGCKECGINEDIEIDEESYYALGQEMIEKIRQTNEGKRVDK